MRCYRLMEYTGSFNQMENSSILSCACSGVLQILIAKAGFFILFTRKIRKSLWTVVLVRFALLAMVFNFLIGTSVSPTYWSRSCHFPILMIPNNLLYSFTFLASISISTPDEVVKKKVASRTMTIPKKTLPRSAIIIPVIKKRIPTNIFGPDKIFSSLFLIINFLCFIQN